MTTRHRWNLGSVALLAAVVAACGGTGGGDGGVELGVHFGEVRVNDVATVDPGPDEAVVADPGAADPGPVDPGLADPGVVDPGTPDPGPADPGPADLGPADPGAGDVVAPGSKTPGQYCDVSAECANGARCTAGEVTHAHCNPGCTTVADCDEVAPHAKGNGCVEVAGLPFKVCVWQCGLLGGICPGDLQCDDFGCH